MNGFLYPCGFGFIVLLGSLVGLPDVGWVGLVVTGTWWLNTKFNKLDRRFDALPCNRCPAPPPHGHKNKSNT